MRKYSQKETLKTTGKSKYHNGKIIQELNFGCFIKKIGFLSVFITQTSFLVGPLIILVTLLTVDKSI